MNVYTDVKNTNKELNDLTSELSQLRSELSDARSFASVQYNSDVASGFTSQLSFGSSYAFGEESRLEALISEKKEERTEKEEELKSKIHFYFSDMLWGAELSNMSLAEYLNDESLVSQWDEVNQICIDRFGNSTLWELCCK
jgi:hypothetical protein